VVPWSDEYLEEDANDKAFDKEQFNNSAFERYLTGEIDVYLDEIELVACTGQQKLEKAREARKRMKETAKDVMSDFEDSSEDEECDDEDVGGMLDEE